MEIDISNYMFFENERNCPLCTANESVLLSKKMQFGINCRTVICQHCAFVFVSPPPTKEAYNRFYTEAYSHFYKRIHPDISLSDIVENRNDKVIFSKIEKVKTIAESNVLEIGPGNGRFLELLNRRGARCSAIEPSEKFRQQLSCRGIRPVGDFLENAATDQLFDIICLFQVLEHFYDPRAAVMKIRSLLGRDGIVVLDVPNILKPFRNFDNYFLRYVHLSYFSPASLSRLFTECGFDLLHIDTGEGNDIYSPQPIFLIARATDKAMTVEPSLYTENVTTVVKTIDNYRYRYPFLIAPRLAFSRLKRNVRKQVSKSFIGGLYRFLKNRRISSNG